MIKKNLKKLKKIINLNNIDGYIVPKNDEYFSEFSFPNRLKTISNFSGSAGFALILKKKNYLLSTEDIHCRQKYKVEIIFKY